MKGSSIRRAMRSRTEDRKPDKGGNSTGGTMRGASLLFSRNREALNCLPKKEADLQEDSTEMTWTWCAEALQDSRWETTWVPSRDKSAEPTTTLTTSTTADSLPTTTSTTDLASSREEASTTTAPREALSEVASGTWEAATAPRAPCLSDLTTIPPTLTRRTTRKCPTPDKWSAPNNEWLPSLLLYDVI